MYQRKCSNEFKRLKFTFDVAYELLFVVLKIEGRERIGVKGMELIDT